MDSHWSNFFRNSSNRSQLLTEYERYINYAQKHNLDIIQLDRVTQRTKTGEKGYGIHSKQGPCNLWFAYSWPRPQNVYIVKGFWSGSSRHPHHKVSFYYVDENIDEIPWKTWKTGHRLARG